MGVLVPGMVDGNSTTDMSDIRFHIDILDYCQGMGIFFKQEIAKKGLPNMNENNSMYYGGSGRCQLGLQLAFGPHIMKKLIRLVRAIWRKCAMPTLREALTTSAENAVINIQNQRLQQIFQFLTKKMARQSSNGGSWYWTSALIMVEPVPAWMAQKERYTRI